MLRWWFHLFIVFLWVSKSRLSMLLQYAVAKVLLPLFDLLALEPRLRLEHVNVFLGKVARRRARQHRPHECENDGLIKGWHFAAV